MKKLFLFLIVIFLNIANAHALTTTFQWGVAGYAGEQDTEVNAFSTNEHIESGSLRAKSGRYDIFYFNISTIPTGSTVTSAILTLNIDETDNAGGNIGLYSILDPNSTGAGSTYTWCGSACDSFNVNATYTDKIMQSSIQWDNAADNISSSNIISLINNSAAVAQFYTGPLSFTVTSTVQGWVTTPNSNLGFLTTIGNLGDPSIYFNGYLGNPTPILTVTYSAPNTPTNISATTINNAKINNAVIN